MKEIIFNDENLKDDEIDKVKRKVRALILTNTGQALLVHYAGLYMLPGGSIDEGESEKDALKRELSEETEIEIPYIKGEPFLKINSYNRNYFDRKAGIINRMTQTVFYKIYTNQEIDLMHTHLTESEKNNGFSLKYTDLTTMRYLIETNPSTNPKKKQFNRELLTVLDEFCKIKERDSEDEER